MKPDAEYPVVINMPEVSFTNLGGTMRLGARTTVFVKDCLTSTAELPPCREPGYASAAHVAGSVVLLVLSPVQRSSTATRSRSPSGIATATR